MEATALAAGSRVAEDCGTENVDHDVAQGQLSPVSETPPQPCAADRPDRAAHEDRQQKAPPDPRPRLA